MTIRAILSLTWGLRLGSAALLVLATGCSVAKDVGSSDDAIVCNSNSDCDSGRCDDETRLCVVGSSALEAFLIEIIPPSDEQAFGGLRFYRQRDDLSRPSTLSMSLNRPVNVTGYFEAASGQERCIAGSEKLPVRVTFRQREWLLGADAPRYSAQTTGERNVVRIEHDFSALDLPPGRYDVYAEPIPGSVFSDPTSEFFCPLVPQLFRDVEVPAESAINIPLRQSEPQALNVYIPWHPALSDWIVDVIHPITGEVLSTRGRIRGEVIVEDPDRFGEQPMAKVELLFTRVVGPDFVAAGRELIRVGPSEGAVGPTLYFNRSALEVSAGEVVVAGLGNLGQAVEFRSWVWSELEPDLPIPARASFTASQISGLGGGVFASFQRSAEPSESGELTAILLAGEYRVRTWPDGALEDEESLSAVQSRVTVWPRESAEETPIQAGHVIELPVSASVTGAVRTTLDSAKVLGQVHAAPTSFLPKCSDPEDPGAGVNCWLARPSVLSNALAENPLSPRATTVLWEGDEFELRADCGSCAEGKGARYDLSFRPERHLGLPWRVVPGVVVDSDVDLGTIQLGVGVAHAGQLLFDSGSETGPFPGALIRVYVYRDDQGEVVDEPGELVPCTTRMTYPGPDDDRCLASLLQVAEARVDDHGAFTLVLPERLGKAPVR